MLGAHVQVSALEVQSGVVVSRKTTKEKVPTGKLGGRVGLAVAVVVREGALLAVAEEPW